MSDGSQQTQSQNTTGTGPRAKPWIMNLAPYVPGRAKVDGIANPVKLSSNESVWGASPKALAAAQSAASHIERYPDAGSNDLRAAIAEVHGLDAGRVVCGAGSDELLTVLIHAYAGPGDEVIHSRYGFMVYPIHTQAAGAASVVVPNKNWAADVDGILAAVTDKTKLVFVDNPNNPTGACLPASEIERLHAGLPEGVLLCIDSAYAECVTMDGYSAGEELARTKPNVIMTRTFSKMYALAGLRVGWAFGAQSIVDTINRIRMPFNVCLTGQAAALEAVRDQDFLNEAKAQNARERDWLTASISALGLTVVPSQTNFILIEFPEDESVNAEAANAYLTERGYLLRWLPGMGLAGHLRLTVGLPEQNRAVVELLRTFLDQGRADAL